MTTGTTPSSDLTSLDAFVFDMDGVITDTARVHEAAWKATFDQFLEEHVGPEAAPFTREDYLEYVDGKPRYDGVSSFLRSRGIELPYGDPSDPADAETVCGVGNRKNDGFQQVLREHGPERYESTVRFIEELRARGVHVAAISSSRNAHEVLARAHVEQLFDAVVTGVEAAGLGLAGKPDPAIFLEAAREISIDPERTAVVEDAISGVEAGRAGGFGLVIGIDRHGTGELADRGADIVVGDLSELLPLPTDGLPTIRELPGAQEILRAVEPGGVAVFLDYDGTLTPIVDDPAAATLPPGTRDAIAHLAGTVPVVIVSGRDLEDVRTLVGLDDIAYAGSHGFDIRRPDGSREQLAAGHLDDLDTAEQALRDRLADIPGVHVERKRFAVAVHDRQVEDPAALERIDRIVREEAAGQPRLRMTGGKRIHELRPNLEWDKGRAIVALLDAMELHGRTPLYIGDDVTDEDGFRSVRAHGGHGLVVRGEDDDRPTLAEACLESAEDVRAFLADLDART